MLSREYACNYHEPPPIDLPITGWMRREVRDIAGVADLAKQIEDEMRRLGYVRKDRFAVTLLLHEAAKNALKHGNRYNTRLRVQVSCHVAPQEVVLEIADDGQGFDPYRVPDPLESRVGRGHRPGFGLLLMRLYSTWIRFNERGNRVTLCKRRSPE